MSPRSKIFRKVVSPPPIKGFKPYGGERAEENLPLVSIQFEEYEALRLCDYDMYNHHQASVLMGVSRPTFTRIYASAREKIARAFVEARQISVEGGKVYFDSDWYHCSGCCCYFNNPEKENSIETCPLCGSKETEEYEMDSAVRETVNTRINDKCVCPACGLEIEHHPGKPCNQEICPACNIKMSRKGESVHGNRKRGIR